MTAQDHVDARRFGGQLQILRKAQVRQQDDQIDLFLAELVQLLAGFGHTHFKPHAFREGGGHRLVDDGAGQADHADPQTAALEHPPPVELRRAVILAEDIGGQDGIIQSRRQRLEPRRAIGELPVRRHGVDLQGVHDRNQRLAPAGDGDPRAMEGVAVVQGQACTFGARLFEEARDAGDPAQPFEPPAAFGAHQFGMRLEIAVEVVQLEQGQGGHGRLQRSGCPERIRPITASSCAWGMPPGIRLPLMIKAGVPCRARAAASRPFRSSTASMSARCSARS